MNRCQRLKKWHNFQKKLLLAINLSFAICKKCNLYCKFFDSSMNLQFDNCKCIANSLVFQWICNKISMTTLRLNWFFNEFAKASQWPYCKLFFNYFANKTQWQHCKFIVFSMNLQKTHWPNCKLIGFSMNFRWICKRNG